MSNSALPTSKTIEDLLEDCDILKEMFEMYREKDKRGLASLCMAFHTQGVEDGARWLNRIVKKQIGIKEIPHD